MPGLPKFGGAKKGASDFFALSIAYAKQEAIAPIVAQAKTMGKGIAGAFLLAVGTVMLGLGLVRALQTELGQMATAPPLMPAVFTRSPGAGRSFGTSGGSFSGIVPCSPGPDGCTPYGIGGHLTGNFSWVPYMGGALFCFLVVAFCLTRVLKVAK